MNVLKIKHRHVIKMPLAPIQRVLTYASVTLTIEEMAPYVKVIKLG